MPSSATKPSPAAPGGFIPLKVREVRQETRDAIAVTFDVPAELKDAFRFTQGQHLTLRAFIGGEETRRSYSICSAAQEGILRVGIKRVPDGVFSAWAHDNIKPGSTIEVMPPMGSFHVPLSPDNARHYAAFAVGSGITPIISIIKTTLLAEPKSRFTLFYGNRASGTVMFRDELADIKDSFLGRFNLVHVMTREHQDIELLNGRLTPEKCELLLKQMCPLETVDVIFLCGPQEMTFGLSAKLAELGFPKAAIKIELFTAAPSTRKRVQAAGAQVAEGCDVSVILDGRRRSFAMDKGSETVLDAALRNGIELPYSCKAGVCSTCRCKLTSGEVDMDASYALESYEIERGFVLACQSYPVTSTLTMDFDQHE